MRCEECSVGLSEERVSLGWDICEICNRIVLAVLDRDYRDIMVYEHLLGIPQGVAWEVGFMEALQWEYEDVDILPKRHL